MITGISSKVSEKFASKGANKGLGNVVTEALAQTAEGVKKCASGLCFTAGTKVKTAEGTTNIEDIKEGDYVYSCNPMTGEEGYKKVLQIFSHKTDELVIVTIAGKDIESTPNHPYWVEGYGFKEAQELEVGDITRSADGRKLAVENVKKVETEEEVWVYNFEVEDWHTYYVGEDALLVHNDCKLVGKLIDKIPSKYKVNFKCVDFAKLLSKEGVEFELVEVTSTTGTIYSNAHGIISTNGRHFAIKIGNIVYDNLTCKGKDYVKWCEDLGKGFPGMGFKKKLGKEAIKILEQLK